ncbi:MAG: hypothetical protein J6A62_06075 [Oscillospiraceae bacterium]|nr:hypothetical protein [Oscillospiraceae bacterium]
MIAKKLRKLIPALLVLALVLPCALTVPVSAAESSGEQIYFADAAVGWTHNSTNGTTNNDGAKAHKSLKYNGKTITLNPIINENLIATTEWKNAGYNCLELYSPAVELSTAKELELVFRYARFAQVDYDEDINIEWAGGFKVYVSVDGGATWSADYATLREHRTLGRGYDGEDMAVIYEAVSTDLSVLVGEGEKINKIKIVPYGPLTDYDGFAHILSITVNAYDELPAAPEVEYITVSEQTLRDIVVDRVYETVTLPWTTTAAITGYDDTNYPAGPYLGPVYARGADTSLERLKSYIDENGNYIGPTGEWTVYGMDCCGVVGDATSRITGHPTVLWAYLLSENVGTITGYDGALPATRKTNEIVDELGRDTILACLAETKPGDLLLCRTDGNVHARLITKVDPDNDRLWYSSTEWGIREATTEDGGETYTYTTANYTNDIPESSCRKDKLVTYAELVPENYTAESSVYVPYTLKEYSDGQVEKQQVNVYDAPCFDTIANGVDVLLESNYHLNKVVVTLTNIASGAVEFTETVYGELDHYTMAYSDTTLNSKLAALENGTKCNLTIDVHSGPVTEVGGEVPVTNVVDLDFTVGETAQALPAITGATTLTAGHYILTEDATAAGIITVSGDVTLCLHGHTLTKTHTGRMFTLPEDTAPSLTICDCSGDGTLNGGATGGFCVGVNAGTVNIKGGTITNFKTGPAGPIFLNAQSGKTSTANMYGGVIIDNAVTVSGGGVALNSTAGVNKFNMYGGTITKNKAGGSGGGVSVGKSTGVFNMYGGVISDNEATSNGGGVNNGGTFVMSDGIISDNTAKNGGGIYNTYVVNLKGGVITKNIAQTNGGGVRSVSNSCTITGSVIISENEAINGAGIYVKNDGNGSLGRLTMSGGTVTGNIASGNGGGVYFAGGNANGFAMSAGTITDNTASGNGGGVYVTGTETVKTESETTTVTAYNVAFTMTGGNISNNTTTGNGGGVYVTNLTCTKGTGETTAKTAKATFTMSGGTISGNDAAQGGGVNAESGTFTMNAGSTVTANKATGSGGGVFNKAAFTMNGGTISNNDAKQGGGVNQGSGGSFNMRGGTISGNETTADGAGVFVAYTTNLSGGTISDNVAGGNGGGVHCATNAFTVSGSVVISGNEAVNGGGIHVKNGQYGRLTMSGGTVTGNIASGNGGGVYFAGGNAKGFAMSGGDITNNTATTYGGGVYVAGAMKSDGSAVYPVTFTMSGDSTISGNKAGGGGGVYVTDLAGEVDGAKKYAATTFNMINGTISSNEATKATTGRGGGVYYRATGGFTMTDGEISNNTAKATGGGVQLMPEAKGLGDAVLTIEKGKIIGNTATTAGGGVEARVYDSNGKSIVILNNGEISYNTATTNGGGVNVHGASSLTMNGGCMSGNAAVKNGGAVALESATSTFTMRGGIVGGSTEEEANIVTGTECYGIAIYVNNGTANLYGGDIVGNIGDGTAVARKGTDEKVTTKKSNGAVWAATGTVNLGADPDNATNGTNYTGAQIYGNRGNYVGAVCINGAGKFKMNGGAIGMNDGVEAPNVAVTSPSVTALRTFGAMTATIDGGVINGGYALSTGTMTITGGEFSWDPTSYVVAETYNIQSGKKGDTTWYRVIAKNAVVPAGYEAYSGGNITGSSDANNPQKLILTGDVTLDAAITITGYVTLDLNGYDLISGVGSSTAAITMSSDGHLTLEDSVGAPYGELRMKSGITGKAINVQSGSSVTMNGGTITGFNSMPIQLSGTFTLKDGRITENKLAGGSGGAFYVGTGTLNIQGGEITNNKAYNHGGAVYTGSATACVNVTGGKISGNTIGDGKYGSAMYGKGTVTISGGEIQGTLVTDADSGGTIIVTGGEIQGALDMANDSKGTITVSGGKFSEDPANEYLLNGCWKETIDEDGLIVLVTKPDITGTRVNLGNSLGIKFFVSINEDKVNLSDYTVKYSRVYNYEDGDENTKADVTDQVITLTDSDYPAAGNYMFYYTGIAAKEMGDKVTLTICNSNGDVMDTLVESLQTYAVRTLNYSGSKDADKKAVVDMLVYGEEAQKYLGYGLDNLATSVLTAEQLALATQDDPTCAEKTPDEGYAGSIISLRDNIVLKMVINKASVAADATTATITYTNHAGTEVPAKDVAVQAYSDSYVMVVVDTLAVADARTTVTCTIGTYSCAYSIESYVADVLASEDADISAADAVTVAMMKFANSAKTVLDS